MSLLSSRGHAGLLLAFALATAPACGPLPARPSGVGPAVVASRVVDVHQGSHSLIVKPRIVAPYTLANSDVAPFEVGDVDTIVLSLRSYEGEDPSPTFDMYTEVAGSPYTYGGTDLTQAIKLENLGIKKYVVVATGYRDTQLLSEGGEDSAVYVDFTTTQPLETQSLDLKLTLATRHLSSRFGADLVDLDTQGTVAARPVAAGRPPTKSLPAAFLAVWEADGDIVGQLLSSNGAAFGGPLTICAATGPQSTPSLVYAAATDTFLIAWTDARNSGATGTDLYARRVAPDGSMDAEFVVTQAAGNQSAPRLAVSQDTISPYLMVWATDTTLGDLAGTLLAANPTTPVAAPLSFTPDNETDEQPDVAYNAEVDAFVVVGRHWKANGQSGNGKDGIVTWRVAPATGTVQVGPAISNGGGNIPCQHPTIAAGPAAASRFLIAWEEGTGASTALKANLVSAADANAALTAATPTTIVDGGLNAAPLAPSAAYALLQDEWVMGWSELGATTGRNVTARRFTTDLTPIGDPITVVASDLEQDQPSLAYHATANRTLFFWRHDLKSLGRRMLDYFALPTVPHTAP